MRYKLRINDHKAHWKTVSCEYLEQRLLEEVAELREALLFLRDNPGSKQHIFDVQLECADVANFVMMIFDNLRKENSDNEVCNLRFIWRLRRRH